MSPSGERLRWRILRDAPADGAWNMAVDEVLARAARPDEGVLRIYRWSRPTLSFGRNQAARGRYDPEACRHLGVDVVRRPTGGREVVHDRELTYAVVVPLGDRRDARRPGGLRDSDPLRPGSLRDIYRTINEALVAALRSLDVSASLAVPRGRTPPVDSGACFRRPAAGEVEVRGRKLVGSAQVRVGETVLQHGSLLLGPPSVELAALSEPGTGAPTGEAAEPDGAAVGLEELLGRAVSFSRVASGVEAALAGALGGTWERDELSPAEQTAAEERAMRFRSADWTWRR